MSGRNSDSDWYLKNCVQTEGWWLIIFYSGLFCLCIPALSINQSSENVCYIHRELSHWGRMMYIYVSNLTIIASDNGLSPGQLQAIIWTNSGISLIGPLGTNFSEILIEIHLFSFKKMSLKMLSAKWRPFCPSLNVLTQGYACSHYTYSPVPAICDILAPCVAQLWIFRIAHHIDGLMQNCSDSIANTLELGLNIISMV